MKLIGPETVSQGCIRPVGNGTNSAGLRREIGVFLDLP